MAEKLNGLGYKASLEDIITSSSVTSEYLYQQLNKENKDTSNDRSSSDVKAKKIKVFMVGNPALQIELEAKGTNLLI